VQQGFTGALTTSPSTGAASIIPPPHPVSNSSPASPSERNSPRQKCVASVGRTAVSDNTATINIATKRLIIVISRECNQKKTRATTGKRKNTPHAPRENERRTA
jgi:hypothetical protein